MAAQTFEVASYKDAVLHLTNFPGVIERSSLVDLDTIYGLTDGTDATPLEANDLLKWFRLPNLAKMLYARVDVEDLDSDASPAITLDVIVSNGTTTKYFFDESTIAQGGGFADSRVPGTAGVKNAVDADTAVGFVIPPDGTQWYIAVKVGTAADVFQNDAIGLTVGYTMALNNADYVRDVPTTNP